MKTKIIFFIYNFILIQGSLFCQNINDKSISDLLKDNKWEMVVPNNSSNSSLYSYIDEYSTTERIITFIYDENSTTVKKPFYLSESKDFIFDESKVGQNINGNYLIVKRKDNKVSVHQILNLTTDTLSIKIQRNPSKRIIGVPVETVYKAKNKQK